MLTEVDTSGPNLGFGALVLKYNEFFVLSKVFKNSSKSGGKNSPTLLIITVLFSLKAFVKLAK